MRTRLIRKAAAVLAAAAACGGVGVALGAGHAAAPQAGKNICVPTGLGSPAPSKVCALPDPWLPA